MEFYQNNFDVLPFTIKQSTIRGADRGLFTTTDIE